MASTTSAASEKNVTASTTSAASEKNATACDTSSASEKSATASDTSVATEKSATETGSKSSSGGGKQLKYLGFLKFFAVQFLALALKLFEFVKDHSGPLKPFVSIIEGVLRPIYQVFKAVARQILYCCEKLLDPVVKLFDKYAPSFIKQLIHASFSVTRKAIQLTLEFIQEASTNGLISAIRSVASKLVQLVFPPFLKLGEFLISQLYNLWLSALKIPAIQKVISTLLPAVTRLLLKYCPRVNNLVGGLTSALGKGASALSSVPLVGGVSKAAAGVATAAQNTVSNAVKQGTDALSKIPVASDASTAARKAVSAATTAASSVVSAATDAAASAASTVTDTAASVISTAAGTATSTAKSAASFVDTVASAATGTAAGAAKTAGSVVDSVASTAGKTVSSLLGI